MIDFRVAQQMSEMNDQEWAAWYVDRARMLAYRHAREFLSDMGLASDDPRYHDKEQSLYVERLEELWIRYKLPDELWGKS